MNIHAEAKLFDGTMQEFADAVIANGKPKGKIKLLGVLDEVIMADLYKRGVAPESNIVVVLDRSVLKYLSHPKQAKGAVIDVNRYNEVEAAVRAPKHIYEDIRTSTLVYVYTTSYSEKKVLKVVVMPNYLYKGVKLNMAKSWGVVREANLNDPAFYRKLK